MKKNRVKYSYKKTLIEDKEKHRYVKKLKENTLN